MPGRNGRRPTTKDLRQMQEVNDSHVERPPTAEVLLDVVQAEAMARYPLWTGYNVHPIQDSGQTA